MKYLFLLAFGMLFSCSEEIIGGEIVDTGIDIFVEDENGNNLLADTTNNTINADSIKLIYLIDGKKQVVYNPNWDCPRAVCHLSDFGNEWIRIFPNEDESEEYPTTYIDWGNGDVDTLKCHFVRMGNGSSITCDTVWFNDLRMFPDSGIVEFGRAFKIVK